MSHGPTVFVAREFEDPRVAPERWHAALATGPANEVFLTPEYQRTWWRHFARGQLLLVGAEHDGRLLALAPLFCDAGMVFFVGSGGSDYLDFVGAAATEADLMEVLLRAAQAAAPGFVGFLFYHVADESPTGAALRRAAERLGLLWCDHGGMPAPRLDLAADRTAAAAIVDKPRLAQFERVMRRDGRLTVRHLRDGAAIRERLPDFFAQHIARWERGPQASPFAAPAQQEFFRDLADAGARAGWVRFTELAWNDEPAAFHFGFCHAGRYLYYKPAYAAHLARRSPGLVLLRQLLREAMADGAHTFDFGLGEETYKKRFATRVAWVRNHGLYPQPAHAGQP